MGNKDPNVQIMGGKNGGPLTPEERAYSDAIDAATVHVNKLDLGRQWKQTSPEDKAKVKPESAAKFDSYAEYHDAHIAEGVKRYSAKPTAKKTAAKKTAPAVKKAAPKTTTKPAAKKAAPAKKAK